MKINRLCFGVLSANLFFVHASLSHSNEKLPVVIDAQEQLECTKDQKSCTAKGGVRVQKGPMHLRAERVRIRFSDKKELDQASAKGDVHFQDERYDASAQQAHYSIPEGSFSAKGSALLKDRVRNHLLSADRVRLQFHPMEGRTMTPKDLEHAHAIGKASLRTSDAFVKADKADYFPQTGRVDALGHVTIVYKRGIIQSSKGTARIHEKMYILEGAKPSSDYVYGLIATGKT